MTYVKVVLLLVAIAYPIYSQKASIETLETIEGEIRDAIRTRGDLRLTAGFIRLAFHDCIGAGRCDGCIDHGNTDNNGLKRYTDILDAIYASHSSRISRADLYAFAGVLAANVASQRQENAVFDMNQFKVGRQDCSLDGQEDDADEQFPGPNMQNIGEITAFFADAFGLNQIETIALMGAHSLGRMETANSGYEGPWVPGNGQNALDNRYYREVANVPWFLKVMPTNTAKHQWQRQGPSLGPGNSDVTGPTSTPDNVLLNSDAVLAVDLQLDQETGAFQDGEECVMCGARARPPPGAEFPCCPRNAGDETCRRYAADGNNPLWMRDFEVSFYKMIDSQQQDLSVPVVEPTTTTTTTPRPTRPSRSPRPRPRPRGPSGPRNQRNDFFNKSARKDAKKKSIRYRIHKLMSELREVSDQVKEMHY